MELLQLRYFCALAKSQHLSNTAKELLITPPSLSLTISKLEKELGLPLFDRVKRNIYLNENGVLFYEKVQEALDCLDGAVRELEQIRDRKENTVRVAMTSPMIWNNFFTEFQASYPDIHLETAVVDLDVLNGKVFDYDFFMGNGWDITGEDWIIQRIGKDEQSLILVSKAHHFASRKTIRVKELENETFITLGSHNPTTDYFVEKLCEAYGFRPKKIIRADYFTRISHLKANNGVVLISDLGLSKNFILDDTIHKIKIKDSKLRRFQTISWKKGAVHSPACQMFLDTVLNYYQGVPAT